ncbi:MAG: divalent-cation tolerance protein CutA [Candidatus Bathyarchaeota archaeon]|nr:divalent-cation tolerance protein CutA [Candidatus Bathyarchaeota archaeon]
MDNAYVVVVVATSSKQEAETIAQTLLEAKLVACVNIVGPVFSRFHWAEKIDHAEEHIMLMKTKADLFEAVSEKVKALHSYKVPEVIALPVMCGSREYLAWIDTVLR